ncbi:conserved hypothetical protein [Mesorhizobium delmotii]|uniref:Uncharacterized protein n=1 Tax=Mesorhizobium delmotii TaxID=1631247 RepID=A0A2P9AGA2_9HYPH|nr:conserved hypothetical protein [Mesorhizobium delmotii]
MPLIGYDEERLILYIRLLAEDVDWRDVAEIVLKIDPEKSPSARTECGKAIWRAPDG